MSGFLRRHWRYPVLLAAALLMMFPLYWMLMTAVSPASDISGSTLHLWPSALQLDNFSRAWHLLPWARWYSNSLAIALVSVVLTVSLNLVAGYVLAKYKFPGRNWIFLAIVSTLMIPIQVVMVPQFRIVAGFGWVDSYWAVIIPRAAEAFGIFLARQWMLGIPDELIEAARLDGAGHLTVLRKVVLPLARPLIAVMIIFTFMYRWNEFAWPLIVLKDQNLFTVPIGLSFLQGQYSTDYSALMGMAMLSALPMLLVFFIFQRYLVEGIARTGLK